MKVNNLIFIKLGGSAITFKNILFKINTEVLERILKEISEILKSKDIKLLLSHGSGSFGHFTAKKYSTPYTKEAFVEIQNTARSLNSVVLESLLKNNIPAISIQPSSCITAENGKIKKFFTEPIKHLLQDGVVPILYGDIVIDSKQNYAILSTEMLLSYLAKKLKPRKIIVGTDVDGVLSPKGTLIKEITKENLEKVLAAIPEPFVPDVTGGMRHKIEELSELGKSCEVEIINLLKPNYIKRAIENEKIGTTIKI